MNREVRQDLSVDVVVVGSGTGMAAALAASEAGLSVIVVEKTELFGGSTARSGGAIWIPGNPALRRQGGAIPRAQTDRYLESVVSGSAPSERYGAFLDHGPAAVAMLERTTALKFRWMRGYPDYFPNEPGGNGAGSSCEAEPFDINRLGDQKCCLRPSDVESPLPMPVTGADYKWLNLIMRTPAKSISIAAKRLLQGVWGAMAGRKLVTGGQAIAAGMLDGLLRAGVPCLNGTRVVDLIHNQGRVTGVIAERDGAQFRINATCGVVLAAGGFDHNMDMRAQYQSASLVDDVSLGARGNVGEGILMGKRAGVGLASMDQAWWYPTVKPVKGYPPIVLADRSLPGSFMINSRGRRFVNEAESYMAFGQRVLELEQRGQPVGQMWMVFDQQYRNSYLMAASIPPRKKLPSDWYQAGIVVEADTPADLAAAMHVPQQVFFSEFCHYNEMATSGVDSDFSRGDSAYDRYYGDPTIAPNPNLRPLAGKLFAVQFVLSDLGTCGGLTADANAVAMRNDGTPMDGLYVIGNNAANAFGAAYPGAGATIGQGITFGYIAVQHMLSSSSSKAAIASGALE
ncbi:FAD-dependent oxidoreductase [uncultured Stenotrophomonas sp.]|uniref:FAD-dependent oxidoreductase n=1 Tax=uncultured Stenotrophomonas sp. TaxID=165438 RepID=UPI0025EB2F86|nr:FAD-dependent oxidoreductase [uncultured Stenotrophomonas sp.]